MYELHQYLICYLGLWCSEDLPADCLGKHNQTGADRNVLKGKGLLCNHNGSYAGEARPYGKYDLIADPFAVTRVCIERGEEARPYSAEDGSSEHKSASISQLRDKCSTCKESDSARNNPWKGVYS
jgi:hypothetical protein